MENKMELQMQFVPRDQVKRGRPTKHVSDKAQTLLDAMGEDYKSVKDLQEESGVPYMSVLALLQSLRKQGMIVKRKHHSVYRLSFKGRVYKSKHMA